MKKMKLYTIIIFSTPLVCSCRSQRSIDTHTLHGAHILQAESLSLEYLIQPLALTTPSALRVSPSTTPTPSASISSASRLSPAESPTPSASPQPVGWKVRVTAQRRTHTSLADTTRTLQHEDTVRTPASYPLSPEFKKKYLLFILLSLLIVSHHLFRGKG